jgi:hypothetical protein
MLMDDKVLLEKVSLFHCVLEIEFPGRRGLDRIPRWGMGWHLKTVGNVRSEGGRSTIRERRAGSCPGLLAVN